MPEHKALGKTLDQIKDPTGLGGFEIALEKSDAERAEAIQRALDALDAYTEVLKRVIKEPDPSIIYALRSVEIAKSDIRNAMA